MRRRDRIALRKSIASVVEEIIYDTLASEDAQANEWIDGHRCWKGPEVIEECYHVYAIVAAAMSKIDPAIKLQEVPNAQKTEPPWPPCPRCGGHAVPWQAEVSGWWRYECDQLCGFKTTYYKRRDAARRGWRRLCRRVTIKKGDNNAQD